MDMDNEKKPLLQITPDKLPEIDQDQLLKICPKCAYGIGGIPYPLTANVVAFYISVFLLEVAQIRPAYASIVLFSGKAWDAITDPTIGILLDKSNTRFGKIKPWLVLSTPFAMVTYVMLWYVPDIDANIKMVYYLLCYCAFQTFLTCYHIPYVSMTMYLSNEQKDRDSATAYRMTCEVFGTVLGVVLQAQFLTLGSTDSNALDPCIGHENRTTLPTLSPEQQDPTEMAYLVAAAVLAGIFLLCCAVVTVFTKEMKDDAVEKPDATETFCTGLKSVLTYGPYIKLLLCFLCTSLALQIIQGNLALYFVHALNYDNFQLALIVILVTALLCLPLWQLLAKRLGKKTALAIGLIINLPFCSSLFFIPGKPLIIFIMSFLVGTTGSSLYLLPWSMIPDVIDDYTVKTGSRKEAIFYSFYVFFTKFAVGLALGFSTLILEFAGYQTGACEQPESVGYALRLLVSAAPVALILIGLLFLWCYPITELKRNETRTKLAEIRERNRSSIANMSLIPSSRASIAALNTVAGSMECVGEEKMPPVVKFSLGDPNDGRESLVELKY
ncbi:sodium-dependent lysophosphatidylcholine symporter 1-like [Saccoglossus kowalevskii]